MIRQIGKANIQVETTILSQNFGEILRVFIFNS